MARPKAAAKGKSQSCEKLDWHERFTMITRGFIEEYSLALKRNEWVLYLALAAFYNPQQKRSFPTILILEQLLPIDRYGRSRAVKRLTELGLVEVWSEKRGRRRLPFYRLLHADEKGKHMAAPQQPSEKELLDFARNGGLPAGYEWFHTAHRKGCGKTRVW